MKPSPDTRSARPFAPDCSFYEYHWDGPKRVHVPVWQPRQTTLVVVFEGVSRHLFSAARILLYYRKGAATKDAQSNVWDVQQLGPAIRSSRGQAQHAPPNPSSLPKLTVAFEVGQMAKTSFHALVLRSPASVQELDRDTIGVLLAHELPLTSDTLSLSLSFSHSTMLWTPTTLGLPERRHMVNNLTFQIEHITTRIVRVLPPDVLRPRLAHGSLPTELLIKTFEDAEFRDSWHDDLLSFAQVCRAWSCAMEILHSRLRFLEDDKQGRPKHLLDLYVLADALREKPLLGRHFRHLTTINFRQSQSEDWRDLFHVPRCKRPARFTTALIAILGAVKSLQSLHLGHLDPEQADALFAALYALRDVHTFSIGQVEERPIGGFIACHPTTQGAAATRMVSVVQLARCMARWPALASLTLHHLHPGGTTTTTAALRLWRFVLRPPACRLTQLTLGRSHVGDKDLAHLFASSARTLERVVLDRIEGVTNAGLLGFLRAIAQNVVYLTVQDVALPPFRQWGSLVVVGDGGGGGSGRRRGTERALDVVVGTMWRLRELRIGGDVASEFMLDRRSRMFVAREAEEATRVPVVRLWFEDVPRLCGFSADAKWPGWSTPGKV